VISASRAAAVRSGSDTCTSTQPAPGTLPVVLSSSWWRPSQKPAATARANRPQGGAQGPQLGRTEAGEAAVAELGGAGHQPPQASGAVDHAQGQGQGETKGQGRKARQGETHIGAEDGLAQATVGSEQGQAPQPPAPGQGHGGSPAGQARQQPGETQRPTQQGQQQGHRQHQQRWPGQIRQRHQPVQAAGIEGIEQQPLGQPQQQQGRQELGQSQHPQGQQVGQRGQGKAGALSRSGHRAVPEPAQPTLQRQPQAQA
jgi:hypothetical protein